MFLSKFDCGGQFVPPSVKGSIIFLALTEVLSGVVWNPNGQLLYVNANEMPWLLKMDPTGAMTDLSPGHAVFSMACQSCHGARLEGGGVFTSSLRYRRQTVCRYSLWR
jgi:quinoprotein glucose dehydrogenase